MDIKKLRSMRSSDSLASISKEMEKIANPGSGNRTKDDRFWTLERDEAGNGSATIRFLIKHEEDELPWVRVFSHGFKGPTGKWYIENSLTTINQDDPVGKLNAELWATGIESNKQIVRDRKRRLNYICNILVINDPKHPENNGKVKLFRFGKKIFDKLMDKANPTFADEQKVNVFDLWEGADFKLRIREVEGYANYDKSEFAAPSELFDGDEEKLVELVNSLHKLSEFVAPDQFKSYDELKRRLDEVLNVSSGRNTTAVEDDDTPFVEEKAPEPKSKPAPKPAKEAAPDTEEDDDLEFFKTIANN